MKNLLKLALGASLAVGSLYEGCIKPETVLDVTIEGAQVNLIRSKDNLVTRLFIGGGEASTYTHKDRKTGKINTIIDLVPIEERAKKINRDWNIYEQNAAYLENDPRWEFDKQIAYEILKKSPPSKRENKYVYETISAHIAHEKSHISDYNNNPSFDILTFVKDYEKNETKATFSALKVSPIELECAKVLKEDLENNSMYTSWDRTVVKNVLGELMGYPDSDSMYKLAHLKKEEVSKKAREISARVNKLRNSCL